MNLQEKIAQTETEIYRTVQNLDWIAEALEGAEVNLDDLRVELGVVTISPKTTESLAAWAKVPAFADIRHLPGNLGSYRVDLPSGVLCYLFVRAEEFNSWDGRRSVRNEVLGLQWPERALSDDVAAFQASTVSQEAGR